MNNIFDIYELEKMEDEINFINENNSKLTSFLLKKIKRDTVAYKELDLFIKNMYKYKHTIETRLINMKNNYTNNSTELKIDIDILEELLRLRTEFNVKKVSLVITCLLKEYNEAKYLNKLLLITPCPLSKTLEKNLRNSKFNIASNEECTKKFVYTMEDIVIKKSLKHLDIEKYKPYKIDDSSYFFSHNLTLGEVDEFFRILKK
ncbi:MAG: hypothetical protein RBS32_04285 [Aliarcobacter sp.]|jgi:hypothetical protein|nr:hypothetical protein [Aliarcobacter sp.]